MFLLRGAAGFTRGALQTYTWRRASEPNGFPAENSPETLFSLIQILIPVCSASCDQKLHCASKTTSWNIILNNSNNNKKKKSVTFTVSKLLLSLLCPDVLLVLLFFRQQKCGISMGLALQMLTGVTLLLTAQFYSSGFAPSSTAARAHCGIKLSVPRAAWVCNCSLLTLHFLTLPQPWRQAV